jgi:hypothetical protein
MKILRIPCLVGFSIPSLALALPGDVAPGPAVTLDRDARVHAVSLAGDGSVAVVGDFSEINGLAIPGVAVLNSDGSVRTSFRSAIASGLSSPNLITLGGQPALSPMWLDDSRLLVSTEDAITEPGWHLLSASGALLPNPFPGVAPRDRLQPRSYANGALVAITSPSQVEPGGALTSRVRRLLLTTGTDDPTFNPNLSGPYGLQVITADDGSHWMMRATQGANNIFYFDSTIVIERLMPNGLVDDTTPARSFSTTWATLYPWNNGCAVLQNQISYYWPPSEDFSTLDLISTDGTAQSRTLRRGFWAVEPDGAVLSVAYARQPWIGEPAQPLRLTREKIDGSTDPDFQPPLPPTSNLQRLSDGRLLLDGKRRILANGNPDPTWQPPTYRAAGSVEKLAHGNNGTVYGMGSFTTVSGQPRQGLARWLSDGSLDETFMPSIAPDEAIKNFTVLQNGHVIAVVTTPSGERALRLGDTGTSLSTYDFDPLPEPNIISPPGIIYNIAPLGDDRFIILVARSGGDVYTYNAAVVKPDGNAETFSDVAYGWLSLLPLADGRCFVGPKLFRADGQPDYTYIPPAEAVNAPRLTLGPNLWLSATSSRFIIHDAMGHVLSRPDFTSGPVLAAPSQMIYAGGARGLTRHYRDGSIDPTFRAPPFSMQNRSAAPGQQALVNTDHPLYPQSGTVLLHPTTQELWIAGTFTRVAGAAHEGIVRLNASVTTSYEAWTAASLRDGVARGPHDDPDGDGVGNWREYAAGTDPEYSDAPQAALRVDASTPTCLLIPRNPGAPEVSVALESSTDLRSWTPVSARDALRKTTVQGEAFEITASGPRRYFRARYFTTAP